MAAVVEVVLAELLHQLEVVETVSQRHGLLEADICSARGGVRPAQGRGGTAKTEQEDERKIRNCLGLKKEHGGKMSLLFLAGCVLCTVSDFNPSECF